MEETRNIRLPWKDWKIVDYIGGGAYGNVYKIERNISGIQENAALKIISKPKNADEIEKYYDNGYDRASIIASYESEIKNYVQEYKLLKELQGQSNIVSCDDFTVIPNADGIGGEIFIRMELLTSLQQILRDRILEPEEIIKLGKDIAHALVLCEKKHIVHRDIKPANIMVSKFGDYKLGDFGVSKIMDHATLATAMGTPEYQAPEVVHMERYGHTADIYSLGITLYWLLNNRKMPFIGADERITPDKKIEAMEKRYRGEKLPQPKNGSSQLKQIVMKACEYHPGDRYASAQDLYDALDALEKGIDYMNASGQENDIETPVPKPVQKEQKREITDWGVTDGTVGSPAGKMQKKAYDMQETENGRYKKTPVLDKDPKGDWKKRELEIKERDRKNKEENEWIKQKRLIEEELKTALDKISVERETTKNKRIDICLALLFVVGGGAAFFSGIILLGVILVFLGLMSLINEVGNTDFNNWMKSNKEKVSNIDDLIKNYPDFAKRLYFEKCPNKHMLYYLEKKNPAVAKEIKTSVKK